MKKENQIKLIKLAANLQNIPSPFRYNGQEGFALISVESLEKIGNQIEKIVDEESN
jgi:hypothetical protein